METASLAGAKLDRYFHVCALFHSRDEEYRVLSSFYREGLDRREKQLHIVDPELRADHITRLEQAGISARESAKRGQLDVLGYDEAYLVDGVFDKNRMLTTVDQILADSLERGYPGTRIMGNMAWTLVSRPGSEQILEYESEVNDVLARNRQPAICVYAIDQLTGPLMMDILRTHPMTLIGGTVHENPFYTPPEQFLPELRQRRANGNARGGASTR